MDRRHSGPVRARSVETTGANACSPRRTNERRRSRRPAFVRLWPGAALLAALYGVGLVDGIFETDPLWAAATGERIRFRYCFTGGGYDCVVDGDTIWLKGVKVRIADIDAPETHAPRCESEKQLGDRATRRLHDLLESGPVALQSIGRDEDVYGRKLRLVLVNGRSVGDTLVSEGLARYYGNGRRPWC